MKAEEKVKKFYEGSGWDSDEEGATLDARLWEDLRPVAREYLTGCRNKLLRYLPARGDLILDAASGPIQYPEYMEYSRGFDKRVCVDISYKALEQAKKKLADRGEVFCASILALPFPDDRFDAVLSLHTIYHIDQAQQEKAVHELLRVAKPNAPVVVVYSNPDRFFARLKRGFTGKRRSDSEPGAPLYFFAHPSSWWRRFEDLADIEIEPWRSLTAAESRRLIPDNRIGKLCFKAVASFERRMPKTATAFGAYPTIVLRKRS